MIDDHGNEQEFSDDDEFMMTPKGWFMAALMKYGATNNEADDEWNQFEGFCIRASQHQEASHAALVFDGVGGVVVGVEMTSAD